MYVPYIYPYTVRMYVRIDMSLSLLFLVIKIKLNENIRQDIEGIEENGKDL